MVVFAGATTAEAEGLDVGAAPDDGARGVDEEAMQRRWGGG